MIPSPDRFDRYRWFNAFKALALAWFFRIYVVMPLISNSFAFCQSLLRIKCSGPASGTVRTGKYRAVTPETERKINYLARVRRVLWGTGASPWKRTVTLACFGLVLLTIGSADWLGTPKRWNLQEIIQLLKWEQIGRLYLATELRIACSSSIMMSPQMEGIIRIRCFRTDVGGTVSEPGWQGWFYNFDFSPPFSRESTWCSSWPNL